MNCTGFAFLFAMLNCTNPAPPVSSQAPFCNVYKPIYWSAQDTRQTKEQIDEMNAAWKRLRCPGSTTGKK